MIALYYTFPIYIHTCMQVPQRLYKVCLYSPRGYVEDGLCHAVFSVSLYHEVFMKVHTVLHTQHCSYSEL